MSKGNMSWSRTHYFLLDSMPTTTAVALTGELNAVNNSSGGGMTSNLIDSFRMDEDGFAIRATGTAQVDNFDISFDREADSIYTAAGTDVYSRLRSWFETNRQSRKVLVEIIYRGAIGTTPVETWEGRGYDVSIAGVSDGDKSADDIQRVNASFGISGKITNLVITRSQDGTFSAALPS